MTDLTLPTAGSTSQQPQLPAALSPDRVRWLLVGLGCATGMEFYTFDSMNLVLTDLTGSLGVSPDRASWLLTVYSSALFFGIPVSIWMAGHFGYKRYLTATIILFAVSSLGCAVSPDFNTMLAWRAIQGLAGAGLVMWWRVAIYVLLPKEQYAASGMKVLTMLYLASALGLLVSGYVTDHFNWRFIFLPNLIFAAAAIWLLAAHFPRVPASSSPRMVKADRLGIVLLAIAVISLQIMLSRGRIDDWFDSPKIQILAWTSAISSILFVFWQISPRNPYPLLDIRLLRDRYVMSSVLIGIFTGMILSGSLFVLPRFLRNVDQQTHSATQTGQIICIYALTAAAIQLLMLEVIARIGHRKTIVIALVMLIFSMLLFNRFLTVATPDAYYFLPLVLYAFCLSPLLPSEVGGTVARIEQSKLLDGVSLYMTFRHLGASLGVAFLATLIQQRETLHSSRLFEHLSTANPITLDWLASTGALAVSRGGYTPVESKAAAMRLLAETGARHAATLSYADAFAFMAAVAVIALCVVPIIPPTPATKR